MSSFILGLVLFGTLCCSVFASDPKSVQVDRQELQEAAERFVTEHPRFVPDLRPSAPTVDEQSG
jgi:hypothetical protein